MAFNINNILNIAGNWWKGAPASVYYDMVENDSDFDEAATNFYDTLVEDEFSDEYFAELPDDEFLVEKAIYQMDKPDAMMTPYGPSLVPEVVDSVIQEYPGILALGALSDDMEGDDYYDNDVWDTFFSVADNLLDTAGSAIDDMMGAIGNKAVTEGMMGQEGPIFSAAGDQMADAVTGLFDLTAAPVYAGTGEPPEQGPDKGGLFDTVKGVAGNMADIFTTGFEAQAEGQQLLAGGYQDIGTGITEGVGDIITGFGEGQLEKMTAQNPQIAAAVKLNKLFEPDEADNYSASPNEILAELQGQTPDTLQVWMNLPGWEGSVLGVGGDPDEFRQQIEESMGLGLDPMSLEQTQEQQMTPGPGGYDPAIHTVLGGSAQGYPVPKEATPQPERNFLLNTIQQQDILERTGGDPSQRPVTGKIDLGGPIPTGEPGKWDENLGKIFYQRIYAIPGVGRSDVLKELPSIFKQTRAMFLLVGGSSAWENIKAIAEADYLTEDKQVTAARGSLETQYAAFLEKYLRNPALTLANPAMLSQARDVARILLQYENNQDFDTWPPGDEEKYTWMDALFGTGDVYGDNRLALINLNLTGGGMGNWSKALQNSAARVMQHHRNMGMSEAWIFERMMRNRTKEDAAPSDLPYGEWQQPTGATDYFGDGAPTTAPSVMGQPPMGDIAPKDLPYGEWQQDMGMGDMPPTAEDPDYSDIFEQVGPAGQAAYQQMMGQPQTSFIAGQMPDPTKWDELLASMPEPFDEVEAEKKAKGLPYNQLYMVDGKRKKGPVFVPTIQYGIDEGVFDKQYMTA